MAKKKKEYSEEDGVWRTIGGRRVFIKKGQSLSDAMKESGKFKTTKSENVRKSEDEKGKKINETMDKRASIIEKLDNDTKDLSSYDRYNLAVSKLENNDYSSPTERQYWAGEIERYKKSQSNDTFEVGDLKRKALETLPKEHIDSHASDLYLKKTKESTELLNRMKDKDSGLLSTFRDQQTGEEWYEVPFANMEDELKEKYSHAFPYHKQTEAEKKYADEVAEYFKGKDIKEEYIKVKRYPDDPNNNEYTSVKRNLDEKLGNDYLPKESKITTQGTSNRKEVSDNIQAHILSYYDNPVDFMEQMDAMDYLPTRWRAGEEMAKGGNYLIYNADMQDYLGTLGINPKGKKFSDDRAFQTYTSLVGRESDRLYTKMEKLFEQYKKEHKNSNATLDDFRKWFK